MGGFWKKREKNAFFALFFRNPAIFCQKIKKSKIPEINLFKKIFSAPEPKIGPKKPFWAKLFPF